MQERHGGPVPRSTARQAPAGKPRALRPVPRATASHHARLCHVPAGRLLRGRLDCGEAVRRRQLWRLDGPEARRVRELHCWQLLLARRYVADVMRRRQRGSRRRHGGMLRLRGWFQGDKGQKACETCSAGSICAAVGGADAMRGRQVLRRHGQHGGCRLCAVPNGLVLRGPQRDTAAVCDGHVRRHGQCGLVHAMCCRLLPGLGGHDSSVSL